MDAEYSEEQELLRDSARDFFTAECPIALVREMMDDDAGMPRELWQKMAELGWMGLAIDEEFGGAGLELVDLAVFLEETGRCLLPAPYFSTVVLGARAIRVAGSVGQQKRWLPKIAKGELLLALAQLEERADWGPEGIEMGRRTPDGSYRLDGCKMFVRDAQCADLLVVPVRDIRGNSGTQGITLLLVDARLPGIDIEAIAFMDGSRKVCRVDFRGVEVDASQVLGKPGAGWEVLARVQDFAKVALSAEACGGAAAMLDMTVAYAKTREQFGRPIGTFQAIQHKCADMMIQVEGTRSATYYAAWSVDNGEADAHASACMAKSYCGEAYTAACGAGIQVHGGLGYTWEQDLHLYYKRAKADELYLGDPSYNRELVARVLLD
jgi:alkylation response protein AidB-like acyl-CoA dehydrogenase